MAVCPHWDMERTLCYERIPKHIIPGTNNLRESHSKMVLVDLESVGLAETNSEKNLHKSMSHQVGYIGIAR